MIKLTRLGSSQAPPTPRVAFDTDSDLDDESFWVKWLEEIRVDEYDIVDKSMVSTHNNLAEETTAPRLSGPPHRNDHVSPTWEPPPISLANHSIGHVT